jgi:hypothetical protein
VQLAFHDAQPDSLQKVFAIGFGLLSVALKFQRLLIFLCGFLMEHDELLNGFLRPNVLLELCGLLIFFWMQHEMPVFSAFPSHLIVFELLSCFEFCFLV